MLKSKKFDWWIMVKVPQMRSTWPFGFMARQTITCLGDFLRSILGCHCSRDRLAAAGSKKDHLENPSKQWSKSCLCSWCRKLYYVYRSIHYIYPMQLWLKNQPLQGSLINHLSWNAAWFFSRCSKRACEANQYYLQIGNNVRVATSHSEFDRLPTTMGTQNLHF